MNKPLAITERPPATDAVSAAARRWHDARKAFLELPPGSPDVRARLNELAEAEAALFAAAGLKEA